MKITSHGAAQEVTGSCHEIQFESPSGHKRVLLDCGLFQGHRQQAAVKNAEFTFDPMQIDAVVLSHAHADHVGRIPLLYKHGYRNAVHCTYATKDLADVMLQDSGYIQEKDEEYFCKYLEKDMLKCDGPLYTQQDAIDCMNIFQGQNYNSWFRVCDGLEVMFLDAGHIIGSAMVVLHVQDNGKGRFIGFSGDLGRNTLPIIRDPAQMPKVDTLICESTYGNRMHEDITSAKAQLKEVVVRTAKRGGKILIPAFSLERTQEIIYELHLLWDAKELPAVPIYIDSPLATRVTEVFMKHPECYDQEMYTEFLSRAHNPFEFSLVTNTTSVDDSKALNGKPGPMIIMAGSGMCEAGRIRHHLRNEIEDDRNTILAVGYMAEHTLGRKIIDDDVSEVRIFNDYFKKRADTVYINAYSGHADMADLDRFVLDTEGLKNLLLVHGEQDSMDAFETRLKGIKSDLNILKPERGVPIDI